MDYTRWVVQAIFVNAANQQESQSYGIYDFKADADDAAERCREDLEFQGMTVIAVSARADISCA